MINLPLNIFGLNLSVRLTFNDHVNEEIVLAMKNVGLLCKQQYFLPRSSLLTICKSFMRPHLDNGDVINFVSNFLQ